SAHDISDGGLAVALAESCFASTNLSANVKLEGTGAPEFALFNERGARCVISVSRPKLDAVLETARQYEVGAEKIGGVSVGEAFRIIYNGRSEIANKGVVIYENLETLRHAWANSLERALKVS